jgi:hypothetical protein
MRPTITQNETMKDLHTEGNLVATGISLSRDTDVDYTRSFGCHADVPW